jgi:hypothetical protein
MRRNSKIKIFVMFFSKATKCTTFTVHRRVLSRSMALGGCFHLRGGGWHDSLCNRACKKLPSHSLWRNLLNRAERVSPWWIGWRSGDGGGVQLHKIDVSCLSKIAEWEKINKKGFEIWASKDSQKIMRAMEAFEIHTLSRAFLRLGSEFVGSSIYGTIRTWSEQLFSVRFYCFNFPRSYAFNGHKYGKEREGATAHRCWWLVKYLTSGDDQRERRKGKTAEDVLCRGDNDRFELAVEQITRGEEELLLVLEAMQIAVRAKCRRWHFHVPFLFH